MAPMAKRRSPTILICTRIKRLYYVGLVPHKILTWHLIPTNARSRGKMDRAGSDRQWEGGLKYKTGSLTLASRNATKL